MFQKIFFLAFITSILGKELDSENMLGEIKDELQLKCQDMFRILEEDGYDILIKEGSFMKAYSECTELFGKPEHEPLQMKSAKHQKNFDQPFCQLVLYSSRDFMGYSKELLNTDANIQPLEGSLRTIGPCCWRIARLQDKRKKLFQRVTLEGNKNYASSNLWGWPPNQIVRAVKLNSCD